VIESAIGSFFTKEQNRPGADKVIVLTQSYWQMQYQESPEVLGKEVRIDDEGYKVIGVAPRVLEAFDARMKFVVPLSWPPAAENPQGRYGVGIQLFGRLKPGVTAGQADAVLVPRRRSASPESLESGSTRSRWRTTRCRRVRRSRAPSG
jgi:putative ABC transport system permease protein